MPKAMIFNHILFLLLKFEMGSLMEKVKNILSTQNVH